MNIESFIFITVFILTLIFSAIIQHIHARINKLQNTVKLQGKMILRLYTKVYPNECAILSEESLVKDWNNPEEDEAWRDL
jgi:ribosomal protein S8